jgi:hypothetical protein
MQQYTKNSAKKMREKNSQDLVGWQNKGQG